MTLILLYIMFGPSSPSAGLSEQVEAELSELDKEEAAEYLASLGADSGGLANLIKATYKQLGLITYFTTGSTRLSLLSHPPNAV